MEHGPGFKKYLERLAIKNMHIPRSRVQEMNETDLIALRHARGRVKDYCPGFVPDQEPEEDDDGLHAFD